MPVSTPISCSIETTSSVAMLPVAPFGTGQPPSSPKLDSNERTPGLERREHVRQPLAARVVEVRGQLDLVAERRARGREEVAHLRAGSPSRSCRRSRSPARRRRSAGARSRTRARAGRGPRRGSRRRPRSRPRSAGPRARARPSTRSSPLSDSSIERLTFLRLCVSDADRKTLISWKRSRCRSAFSSPRSFGISTESADVVGRIDRGRAPRAASASCGITSARTKLVTSSRRSPVRASTSISRTLSAVAITSGSFWKPSRGPTSRMLTSATRWNLERERVGSSADAAAPLVVLAGGTGGAKLARGMLDVVARRPRRDRQHGRRRRDPRRPRLARPRPRHVLARRPDRRARLGPPRRHVHGDGRRCARSARTSGSTSATATSRSAWRARGGSPRARRLTAARGRPAARARRRGARAADEPTRRCAPACRRAASGAAARSS